MVALLAAPALGMKIHQANLQTLPADIPEVQTFTRLTQEFPVEGATAQVVVHAPEADKEAVASALAALDREGRRLRQLRGVRAGSRRRSRRTAVPRCWSWPSRSRSRTPGWTPPSETLRDDLVPATLGTLDGDATYAVGGGAAESLDWVDRERSVLPLVIGTVLLLTLLMMGFAFRSAPIAVVSTVLNLASVGVAFGILTLVFQHGWGAGALDFTSPGFVIDWIPLFVMVVLVGLSMDYHVFVISRVREHVQRGLPTRIAVERGISDTAGVVTSAAAVMVSVFAIFATLSMMEMKMMGVGLSAAILIDATLIRLVILPAVLVLLGDRAWWPTRPSRPVGERVVESDRAYELAGQSSMR